MSELKYGWRPGGGVTFEGDSKTNLPTPWGAFKPLTARNEIDASRFATQRGMSQALSQGASQMANAMSQLSRQGGAVNSGARERMAIGAGKQSLAKLAGVQMKGLNDQAKLRTEVEKYNINFLRKLFDEQRKQDAALKGSELTKERVDT